MTFRGTIAATIFLAGTAFAAAQAVVITPRARNRGPRICENQPGRGRASVQL